jgi:predicted ferric reductase
MRQTITGVFWIFFYLLIVLSPLAFMMVRPTPAPRGFWVEFSIGLGFVGLLQMALQFLLIARYKHLTAPYGIDLILKYHRQIALVALGLIVAHPMILVIDNPSLLPLLNPFGGTWASRAGNSSVYLLILLIVLSLFRKQLKIGYEVWRVTHAILSVMVIVLAHIHVSLAGHYTDALWKELALLAISGVMIGFFVYLRLIKPILQQRRHFRVTSVRPERGNTWVLTVAADGHAGMPFKPGQFAWLKFGRSAFTPQENPFSFSSSASNSQELSFGIKELGDFTRTVKNIKIGTPAYLDGPHGSFSIDLLPEAGYVFIAGGIGITPFISMLETMADRKDKRPVILFYGEKNLNTAAFREELAELESKLDLKVIYVLDSPDEDWDGETGYITKEVLARHLPEEGIKREFLICGPNVMTDSVEDALQAIGIPLQRIHSERFDLV